MTITDDELVGAYLAYKRELIKRAKDNGDLAIVNLLATSYFYELGMLEAMVGTFIHDCENGVEINGETYTIGG